MKQRLPRKLKKKVISKYGRRYYKMFYSINSKSLISIHIDMIIGSPNKYFPLTDIMSGLTDSTSLNPIKGYY